MIESTTTAALTSPQQSRPKKRIHRSPHQWQALLDDFHRSGLPKEAFCKQRGVATSSLNRWQRVIERQAQNGDFIDVTEPLSRVPATPSPRHDSDNAWQVELALGNGIVLRLRTA